MDETAAQKLILPTDIQFEEATGAMSTKYVDLQPCAQCKERPAQIIWQFEPRDFGLELCWQCEKAAEILNLRLCALCAVRLAAGLLRDVTELTVGYDSARAQYHEALKRVGL